LCRVRGCWYVGPRSASRQGERRAFQEDARPLSESAAASKAVNRKANRHALLETLAIRQGPNDRVQLPAALLAQNPSRGQDARPVNCNELFGSHRCPAD
jgi:hypothetical protein